MALRCVVGTQKVATRLVDSTDLVKSIGVNNLERALVRPRRPYKRNRSLLRLLKCPEGTPTLFRWDTLFIEPQDKASESTYACVLDYLATTQPAEVVLGQSGDTLILDNWRMIHGRSPVLEEDEQRRIERTYFGALH